MGRYVNEVLENAIGVLETTHKILEEGNEEPSVFERVQLDFMKELREYRSICDSPEKLKLIDELYLERCEEINRLKAELAEKEEEFCEWKFEETTGIVWHCGNECTTYNLPYAKNLEIILKDFECKCPYCGRKIKEVQDGED